MQNNEKFYKIRMAIPIDKKEKISSAQPFLTAQSFALFQTAIASISRTARKYCKEIEKNAA